MSDDPCDSAPWCDEARETLQEVRHLWSKMELLLPDDGPLHQLGQEMTELLA